MSEWVSKGNIEKDLLSKYGLSERIIYKIFKEIYDIRSSLNNDLNLRNQAPLLIRETLILLEKSEKTKREIISLINQGILDTEESKDKEIWIMVNDLIALIGGLTLLGVSGCPRSWRT